MIHNFAGGANDGSHPNYGPLVVSGSTLYGTTSAGGTADDGVLFSIPTTGGSINLLHSFTGPTSDGVSPEGPLVLSGSNLYGMTNGGGSNTFYGTLFSIPTTGGPIQILHSFDGVTDGQGSIGAVNISGSTLYGISAGANGYFFSSNLDGTGFNVIHHFNGSGSEPNTQTGLLLFGSNFYGLSARSGDNHVGMIYSLTPGGTVHELYAFAANDNGGDEPLFGSLTPLGTKFYGMTSSAGAHAEGTLFSINPDGTGYSVLHAFGASSSDGIVPFGSLTVIGNALYGMTSSDSIHGNGTIFSYIPGGAYSVLHTFNGTDGSMASGDLVASGQTLYGMTNSGGTNGDGVIFSLTVPFVPPVPEPTSLAAASLCGALFLSRRRRTGIPVS